MILIAAIAGFFVVVLIAYILFAPPAREEETEWTIFGTLLFGEMDGDE